MIVLYICGLCCTFFMYNVPTQCMHTMIDINTAIANEHFKVKCNKTSIAYTCMGKIVSFLFQRERSVTTYNVHTILTVMGSCPI